MTELTVEELLRDHQDSHSERQIDSFILGESGCTTYGMYKQCLRELEARKDAMQEVEDDIVTQRRELRQRARRLDATLVNQMDTQREYDRFLMHARALKKKIGELTPEKRRALDDEMWVQKLTLMLALDVFTQGVPSYGTGETIFSCPPKMREAIVASIPDREAAAKWLQTEEAPRLPASLAQADEPGILPNGV